MSKKIKIVYLFTRLKNAGPINQTLNIIKNIDSEKFTVEVFTLFKEVENDSLSNEYVKYGVKIRSLNCTPKNVFFNINRLKKFLSDSSPDIIHSIGMLPYRLSKIYKNAKHITTVRNYFFEDYIAKHGYYLGNVLANVDLINLKKNHNEMLVCSESLHNIYKEKHKLSIPFIRNGVDFEKYSNNNSNSLTEFRSLLNLPHDKTIGVFTGQFVDRKNQQFVLESISEIKNNSLIIVFLGKGKKFEELKNKYKVNDSFIFKGEVSNVSDYLKASDFYISSSRSEGLPNGVLEAIASKLPVLLSNIPQHEEITSIDKEIGKTYIQDNKEDFKKQLKTFLMSDLKLAGKKAYDVALSNFSASYMSELYQNEYVRRMNSEF